MNDNLNLDEQADYLEEEYAEIEIMKANGELNPETSVETLGFENVSQFL